MKDGSVINVHIRISVKLGRQVHVTLVFDQINGSTLGNKCFC